MSAAPTVARRFIEALARRGITKVFTNAGTDHAPLIEALVVMQQEGVTTPDFQVVPHENLAMSMAHGYYAVTGKPAAVLLHVTVGTANAICSLMNTRRSYVPVLLLAGKTPHSQEGHAGSKSVPIHWGQDAFDQGALVREYTKWDYELRAYQDVDALVERALSIAMSEPRGPVYLTLPRELLADDSRAEPAAPVERITAAAPAADAIERLADALARASNPLIVTSTVGASDAARAALERLADRYSIPVLQSWPYAVNIASDHPMNLRTGGTHLVAEADVILVVDSAVPWIPRRARPRDDAHIVHLGPDPAHAMYPYRSYPATEMIAGNSAAGLEALEAAMSEREPDAEAASVRREQVAGFVSAARERRRERIESAKTKRPIDAAWASACINSVKSSPTVIVNELGVPLDFLEFADEDLLIGETTGGGLGSGTGMAIGAKLADPERDVICCVGDGSFMFGNPTPTLLVAQSLAAPIVILIANNGMWYAVEQSTLDVYPEGAAADRDVLPMTMFGASPDYAALAESCGALGLRVDDPSELPGALQAALDATRAGRAAVIDMITEPGTR